MVDFLNLFKSKWEFLIALIVVLQIIAAIISGWKYEISLLILLFTISFLTRLPGLMFPMPKVLELATVCTFIVALQFGGVTAFIFGFLAMSLPRCWGRIESPSITIAVALAVGIAGGLVPTLMNILPYPLLKIGLIYVGIRIALATILVMIINRRFIMLTQDFVLGLIIAIVFNSAVLQALISMGVV